MAVGDQNTLRGYQTFCLKNIFVFIQKLVKHVFLELAFSGKAFSTSTFLLQNLGMIQKSIQQLLQTRT